MMTSTRTRRMRRGTVPWWMTRLAMMRGRSPWGRWWGAPSRPLSHAGPEGPTRGSRATPVPAWRWRRRRGITSPMTLGTRGKELLSLDLARSRRERLAVVDRWRLGEESGDVWERRSRRRARSPEDLSRELLWWRESLPARFVPDLCWARDASRSPEGLSCRSASEPMFPWGTAEPTVDWGGASPCNCCQYSFMSSKNWAFQSWTISCVGPRETFPSVCGVIGRAVTVVLVVDAIGTKGGVAPGKNPRKRGEVETVFLSSDEDVVGGRGGRGPGAGGPPAKVAGPGRRIGPVEDVRGAGPRTCSVVTAGPRPGQVQGEGGGA